VLHDNINPPCFSDKKVLNFLKNKELNFLELDFCNSKILIAKNLNINNKKKSEVTFFFYTNEAFLGTISYSVLSNSKNNTKIYNTSACFIAPFDHSCGLLSNLEVSEMLFNIKDFSEWIIWNKIL